MWTLDGAGEERADLEDQGCQRGQGCRGAAGRTYLHEGELLLAGVVVARGSLVLLRRARAVLVAELVRGVNELPGVLQRAGVIPVNAHHQQMNG